MTFSFNLYQLDFKYQCSSTYKHKKRHKLVPHAGYKVTIVMCVMACWQKIILYLEFLEVHLNHHILRWQIFKIFY